MKTATLLDEPPKPPTRKPAHQPPPRDDGRWASVLIFIALVVLSVAPFFLDLK